MRIFNKFMLLLIGFYRRLISPMLPSSCRFTPTCSSYSYQAFQKYPFFKALWLSVVRILKCHPFHSGGDDPLP
ncbi:MAG: membrane protein insertion efficiency factor YidD [Candidatus Cloacimonetes bacterium]|nr:membrane protein insertion efficiency factor YidD [Candidatus Cloacimonadota bacterium]MCF7813156.1 membrane protein insertion efficiency factor YidD [Candidatus Cloacimonadota bacterium]MCF7867604.1 membrane protein insertion efficiency factor YidD [Candidatus Cloacimonadota bacterium]MCF7883121.1 membrane protein insertion efficiency factor YidD [Candidatus Cloacimonadota bacterium]